MNRGLAVVVIGQDREPTAQLVEDLRRLGYRPSLLRWPAAALEWDGPRPLAVLIDLRVLSAHARTACQAARTAPLLRRSALVAVIPEAEAPRLDLSLGVDDLILWPYRLSELAARLRLIQWRVEGGASTQVLRAGKLALNQSTYEVSVDGVPVELTLREYELLLFLMQNPRRVFSRADLLDQVWGQDYYGGTRTVDVHIRRLRAKIGAAGDLIQTVRGVGYRFVPPD